MVHQLSVLCLERMEQGLSLKEICEESYGNGFSHYDWKLFPYIEERIKKWKGEHEENLTDSQQRQESISAV